MKVKQANSSQHYTPPNIFNHLKLYFTCLKCKPIEVFDSYKLQQANQKWNTMFFHMFPFSALSKLSF
jgi:hypothetical protein